MTMNEPKENPNRVLIEALAELSKRIQEESPNNDAFERFSKAMSRHGKNAPSKLRERYLSPYLKQEG
jgi:hypothetical protein